MPKLEVVFARLVLPRDRFEEVEKEDRSDDGARSVPAAMEWPGGRRRSVSFEKLTHTCSVGRDAMAESITALLDRSYGKDDAQQVPSFGRLRWLHG